MYVLRCVCQCRCICITESLDNTEALECTFARNICFLALNVCDYLFCRIRYFINAISWFSIVNHAFTAQCDTAGRKNYARVVTNLKKCRAVFLKIHNRIKSKHNVPQNVY